MSHKPGKPLAQQAVFLLQCAISSINVSATAIPGQSRASHDAGVPRVAPQWRHGRQIPSCFLDLTRFNHPQTDNFIQLSSEMPVCRQNSVIVKVTVTLPLCFPPIFTWFKRRLGVCQCCHSAAVFSSGFGGITIFSTHTDRRSVFCSPDLCL